MRLTKEQLTRPGLRRKDVAIPDNGGIVSIRELTAAEVRDYAAHCRAIASEPGDGFDRNADLLARIVVLGVVDDQGKPLFGPDDAEAVKSMSLATLNHLAGAISAFSGVHGVAADRIDDEKKDAGN